MKNIYRIIIIILFTIALTIGTLLLFVSSDPKFYQKTAENYLSGIQEKISTYEKISGYKKDIKNNPQDANAYVILASAIALTTSLNDLDKIQEIIEYYNKAIELDPQFKEAYEGRGISKILLGQYKEAVEDFNKTLEIDPEYTIQDHTNDLLRFYLLANDERKINYKEKIENYVVELNPQNTSDYYDRGVINLILLGNYEEAMKDLEKAKAILTEEGNVEMVEIYEDLIKKMEERLQ